MHVSSLGLNRNVGSMYVHLQRSEPDQIHAGNLWGNLDHLGSRLELPKMYLTLVLEGSRLSERLFYNTCRFYVFLSIFCWLLLCKHSRFFFLSFQQWNILVIEMKCCKMNMEIQRRQYL